MKFSALFWPIEYKNDTLYILDETLLPGKVSYIKTKKYEVACQAIKDMRTRAVGQVILVFYIFLMVIRQNKNKKNLPEILQQVAKEINASRPTLPFKVLTDMVMGWVQSSAPLEKLILGFLDMLKNKRIKQAEEASQLINDCDTILTHCNISGLMPLIADYCKKENKKVRFFVTETRPYLQGSRLTAWELHEAGYDVTVICDSMVSQVMSERKISKVIVGADHLAQNGDIANKIGTYQIALLARYFKVPFFVVCPPASKTLTGRDIPIEVRPDKELLEYQGISLAPKGVKAYYPAFDITPAYLITKHIYLEGLRHA